MIIRFLYPISLMFLLAPGGVVGADLTALITTTEPTAQAVPNVLSYRSAPSAVESRSFAVSVNGMGVFTEKYKNVHYAHFAFSGKADLVVTSDQDIKTCTLSPEGYNIPSTRDGRTISLTIAKPCKLVLRINDGDRLFLFADPMETHSPKPGDPGVVNLTEFGVDPTGKTLNTEKIQKAITAVEKDGVLFVPPGIYQTGMLRLKSDMTLYLAAGAILKGSPNPADYPSDAIGRRLILIADAARVAIQGRGIIDGNGAAFRASGEKAHLLTISNSKDIRIEDIFLRESASWNTHILNCDGVTVRNVKMINDVSLSNTDGIDPDSSNNVLIEDSFIYAGDDAFAVKSSGRGGAARDTTNIAIRDNVVLTQKSALKVGTETRAAAMNRIRFENNQVLLSDRGMALYCNDGADISEVSFVGNRFEDNFPDSKRRMIDFAIAKRDGAGQIRSVLIRDCTFNKPFPKNSTLEGLDPQHLIQGVKFENFVITGNLCRNAEQAHVTIGEHVQDIKFEVTQ